MIFVGFFLFDSHGWPTPDVGRDGSILDLNKNQTGLNGETHFERTGIKLCIVFRLLFYLPFQVLLAVAIWKCNFSIPDLRAVWLQSYLYAQAFSPQRLLALSCESSSYCVAMSAIKLRRFRRKSFLRRIYRHGARSSRRHPHLLQPSNQREWHPSCMMNFVVTSLEVLSDRRNRQLWIDPVKVILERDYFDLKLSSKRPIENMERSVKFPGLEEKHTVEQWNLLALRGIVDNYLRFFHDGARGKILRRKYLIHIICLQFMQSVINGFIDSFTIETKNLTIEYLKCYVILRRLSMQVHEFGGCR